MKILRISLKCTSVFSLVTEASVVSADKNSRGTGMS